jgi:hypothetical protein
VKLVSHSTLSRAEVKKQWSCTSNLRLCLYDIHKAKPACSYYTALVNKSCGSILVYGKRTVHLHLAVAEAVDCRSNIAVAPSLFPGRFV